MLFGTMGGFSLLNNFTKLKKYFTNSFVDIKYVAKIWKMVVINQERL
jgi:hypothetical protein